MNVLNMLNTKYIIQADENKRPSAYPNMGYMGNAWFVEEVLFVKNADEELAALDNFDPAKTAIIDERFTDVLNGFEPAYDSLGQISLIDYKPNHLQYESNTQSDQLAVFSEIYYDKGWNAYIDDNLVPHIRVNYLLRALVIPAGKHKIDFRFEPKVYFVGEKISFASSLFLILVVLGFGFYEIRKYFKKTE
jgi:hypothetical protein